MLTTGLALLLPLTTGCANVPKGDQIRLDWEVGETFHVASTRKVIEKMTEENSISFDEYGLDLDAADPVLAQWSETVVWSFQVLESGLVPDVDDDLYTYAQATKGTVEVAVLRVHIDPTLNDDPEILEADPVVYLVFQQERNRLAGVITYTNMDGERTETAYSATDLGTSWNMLSQSNVSELPTYLAPAAARWMEGELTLENGKPITMFRADRTTYDVIYDDEMDDTMVVSRYELGAPWPTWTVAENVESWLLSDDTVSDMRARMPHYLPEVPEDLDYRDALRTSINIDDALVLDEETMAGGWEARVPDKYLPWAGSWWPLKEGYLVFGYEGRKTFSDRIKEDIDPLKEDLDKLSDELREMDKGDEGREEKVESYRKMQGDLTDKLMAFYDGIRDGLDGGQITIADGKMTHAEDDWSYDLNELSPMDKYALVDYLEGKGGRNPFYISAWELLNQYNPSGGTWWGHCNGWSAAAILMDEPRVAINRQAGSHDIEFTTADLKGLVTESHYSTYSNFYGQRYNDEEDDLGDLTPAAFHKLVTFYTKKVGIPLVFDVTATEAVWNYPFYQVKLTVNETTDEDIYTLVNINTATVEDLDALPEIGPSRGSAIVEHREEHGPFQAIEDIQDVYGIGDGIFDDVKDLITVDIIKRTFTVVAYVDFTTDAVDEDHVDDEGDPRSLNKRWGYTLVTDDKGLVLEGTWDSEGSHPDFAWSPYHNPRSAPKGGSENPFLDYAQLLEIMGEEYERH